MTWSNVTSIALKGDWQFTQPIEGEFFRVKHVNAPLEGVFAIAQAQLNSDDSIDIGGAKIFRADSMPEVIQLIKPVAFAQRRIGVRRLPITPTLELQLRTALRSTLFIEPRSGSLNQTGSRKPWSIEIEVSDSVTPPIVSLTPLNNKIDSLAQQINVFDARSVEVQTGINSLKTNVELLVQQVGVLNQKVEEITQQSSGSASGSAANQKVLEYLSDGDTNGVFYWIGTNYGTEAWTNPYLAQRIDINATAYEGTKDQKVPILVDRQAGGYFATGDGTTLNQKIIIDLGLSRKLKLSTYSLRGRGQYNDNHLRNWHFQGKNEQDSTWEDLDIQLGNTTIMQGVWFTKTGINTNNKYRFFQILQTGANSEGSQILSLGEIELYGTLFY